MGAAVVFGDASSAVIQKNIPGDQRHRPALFDRLARELELAKSRLTIHRRADVGGQALGGLYPQRLVQTLNHALGLRVVRQRVLNPKIERGLEPDPLILDEGIGVAGAIVHVENPAQARSFHRVSDGIEHGKGGFRQRDGKADQPPRGNVDDRGDLRAERPTVERMLHFGIKTVAVGAPHVIREQVGEVAASERPNVFELTRPHAPPLTGHFAQLAQKAPHLMYGRPLRAPDGAGLPIGGFDRGFLWLLVKAEKFPRPARNRHVALRDARGKIRRPKPALQGADGRQTVIGFAPPSITGELQGAHDDRLGPARGGQRQKRLHGRFLTTASL